MAGRAWAQVPDVTPPAGSGAASSLFIVPQVSAEAPLGGGLRGRVLYFNLLGAQPGQLAVAALSRPLTRHVSAELSAFGLLYPQADDGSRPTDRRVRVAATGRLPLGRFVLSDRNMLERRWQPAGPATRYRNLLRLSDSLRLGLLRCVAYVAGEVFYDWRAGRWTTSLTTAGVGVPFARRFTGEVYYSRQFTRGAASLNVYGLAGAVQLGPVPARR